MSSIYKYVVTKLYVVLTVHLITVEIYFTLPAYAQNLTTKSYKTNLPLI
jgi:hypothetical protein